MRADFVAVGSLLSSDDFSRRPHGAKPSALKSSGISLFPRLDFIVTELAGASQKILFA
ncbi:MAG TPA: hypothetical protein VKV95_08825 [Terriglobia bacterium]|nr:hypothetical protein [Terriglobia bacterium]